ncbi:hypothetical protein [Sediminibacillus halophilus]|uniref:DNase/tRNase domain of colicin-like bacteriocin n=1 Tax=Sediminibacillus halophilus TaxID=482461 RepID=A0A1G9RR78_9BACI|nr:hypothetical protein [Sediminibacillus halophilus]SDM25696.1 hypothetical protein SAMN05216244_2097 [Sediminibacillus halophilus]
MGNIGALAVVVGATVLAVVVPPVGVPLALTVGTAYGTMELGTAVTGKDWASGRELGTGERWLRGALSPLDIVPGVAGIKRFSSGVRTANQAANLGQFGLKAGLKTSIQQELRHVGNMVTAAGRQSTARLKSAGAALKDRAIRDAITTGKAADSMVTSAKNIASPRRVVSMNELGNVHIPAENTRFFENKIKDTLTKADGASVSLGVKGTGNKIDSDTIKKYIRDIEGRTGRELPKNQTEKLKEALRNKEYKKMSPIETAKHRAEFDKVKNKVIKEWEENTGQKWPMYNENVISEKTGKIIRKQGDKYDAHHIIENTFGGEHEWWNMHPAKFPNEHQAGIHGAGSPASTLFKGGIK